MTDGNQEVFAHDHLHLTGGDDVTAVFDFIRVAVVHRACDNKELIVIAFQLRPLVSDDGIFHDQLMNAELLCNAGHLVLYWLHQSHPYEAALVFGDCV